MLIIPTGRSLSKNTFIVTGCSALCEVQYGVSFLPAESLSDEDEDLTDNFTSL